MSRRDRLTISGLVAALIVVTILVALPAGELPAMSTPTPTDAAPTPAPDLAPAASSAACIAAIPEL